MPTPGENLAQIPTRQQSLSSGEMLASISTQRSPLPSYGVPGEDLRTSTPEPIKVTRSKKKGTGKKKRTLIAPGAGI